jgi:pilus assembly protein CpaE
MPAQEKIRVLIVDDINETRENIRRLLQFDLNIEVVGAARNGQEGIDLAGQLKPDVVIMDINMPDMDGISATEAIRRKVASVQVVILSVQSDPSYMRRAMLAGARDFLTKPPMIDELTSAIRHAGAMAQEERAKSHQVMQTANIGIQPSSSQRSTAGKIIAIYSPKGGTGCTTIATNLSMALQSESSKVVLVDGHMQYGDVTVFLNEQAKNCILDLTPRVDELDTDVVTDVMIKHAASGIHILAAPPRPEMADVIGGERYTKLLKFLRTMYSYIIIDTDSYLTDEVQAALEEADLILLVTTQDISAIKNANDFLMLADASGVIHRNQILFLMNRYDKRVGISPERVGESLRQPIVASLPIDDHMVTNSIIRGVPFFLDNKNHPLTKSIITLAETIRDKFIKLDEIRTEPVQKAVAGRRF